MTEKEKDELLADCIGIEEFLEEIKEAQEYKDHVGINMIISKEGSNLSSCVLGVDLDNVAYNKDTGCLSVGGWRDNYSFTVPVPDNIYRDDVTPACDLKDTMTEQFDFWIEDDICVAFLITYDNAYISNLI